MSRPPRRPEGPPPEFPPINPPYSFDMASYVETVMELQRSMATLTERVNNLIETSKTQGQQFEKIGGAVHDIGKEIHGAKVGLKVGLAVISVFVASAVGFVAWLITNVLQPLLVHKP